MGKRERWRERKRRAGLCTNCGVNPTKATLCRPCKVSKGEQVKARKERLRNWRKVTGGATLSECLQYRYRLVRVWDDIYPHLICILHNPSTADTNTDDATIRRLIGFAKRFQHGGIVVYNLCAYRATDPQQLAMVSDPFGPDNDRHLSSLVDRTVLCAWGNTTWTVQEKRVIRMLRNRGCLLMCLGMTKQGHPKHPVRLPYDAAPVMQIMELGLE